MFHPAEAQQVEHYSSPLNARPQVQRLKPRLQPDPAARLLILQRPRFGHLRGKLVLPFVTKVI
jgi:hypothetical protein